MMMSGSQNSCEIVSVAHDMGITVYETDWYEDSPAKKVVDKSFMVSTADVDAVVELCQREKVDGVISGFTDSVLTYQLQVCEKLGVPFCGDKENIAICTDKKLFKDAAQKAGLPVVPYVKLTKLDYEQKLCDIKLPVVFKPVDNSGSRGVFKCFTEEDKAELFKKSLSFSKSGEVLAEKLMNAENEFSVYYMLNDGEVHLNAMMDRIVMPSYYGCTTPITQACIFPSSRLEQWELKVDPFARRFFKQNNKRNGYIFMQGFCDQGNLYVHEIGYRLNGGVAYKIVEQFCGFNQIEQLVRFTLTGKMDQSELKKANPYFSGCGILLEATLNEGVIGSISGIDEIRNVNGVLDCYQNHFEGDFISGIGTSANIFADIYIVDATLDGLIEISEKVVSLLKVYDEEGNDMLLPKLDRRSLNNVYSTNKF